MGPNLSESQSTSGDLKAAHRAESHITRPRSLDLITRRSRVRIPPPLLREPLLRQGSAMGRAHVQTGAGDRTGTVRPVESEGAEVRSWLDPPDS